MALWTLLVPGVFLCTASTAFLVLSMITDQWFVIDATTYRVLCPEDELFEYFYPWKDELPVNEEVDMAAGNENSTSGKSRTVTVQRISNRAQRFQNTKMERPASDSPALPLTLPIVKGDSWKPAPMMERILEVKVKASELQEDRPSGSQSDVSAELDSARLESWNHLVNELSSNLLGFGGRDVTFDRTQNIKPSGSRNNDCVNEVQKSLKTGNNTVKCLRNQSYSVWSSRYPSIAGCTKRQFSTFTGLWRTCYWDEEGTFLSRMIRYGNLTRCAPVPYSNLKTISFPVGLSKSEIDTVYDEEWKTLHLRRILTSFLCMAAPVQIFGLILILIGWKSQHGFIVYSGGLVLVMSGTFQLLAIGTSILLFDVELRRSPGDIYRLPSAVEDRFGHSAHASWIAAGCAVISGIMCALAPTFINGPRRPQQPHMNGTTPLQYHTEFECVLAIDNNPTPYDMDQNRAASEEKSPEKSSTEITKMGRSRIPLEKQAYSVDSGSYQTVNRPIVRDVKLDRWIIDQKTRSVPNLRSDSTKSHNGRTRHGRSIRRSSRRRSARALSPVAIVRTPQAAIMALEEEQKSRVCEDGEVDGVYEGTKSRQLSESVDDRMFARSSVGKNRLPYSHSLSVSRLMYDYQRPALASVNISQRMRHARYARRTSHSYDGSTVIPIMKTTVGVHVLGMDERRTRSLPRAAMQPTPLSEVVVRGDPNALRDHCELFLQRQGRLGGAVATDFAANRGRISPLAQIQHQTSEDAGRHFLRVPQSRTSKWWQEGSRWSKSLDDGRSSSRNVNDLLTPPLSREGTLDIVEECAELNDNQQNTNCTHDDADVRADNREETDGHSSTQNEE